MQEETVEAQEAEPTDADAQDQQLGAGEASSRKQRPRKNKKNLPPRSMMGRQVDAHNVIGGGGGGGS